MAGELRISLSHNIDDFISRIEERERHHVPFVTAYALTKTAQDVKAAEVETMAHVFDRPTRFTLDSLYVKPATKTDLEADVRFKDGFGSVPAWRYLGPEVEGGARHKKSFERALERAGILKTDEFAVPGAGVRLDANGNMPGSLITRILSAVGANPDATANRTARSLKRHAVIASYFVARDQPHLRNGIYQRGGKKLHPVLIFAKAPRYSPRFPFFEKAREIIRSRFAAHFSDGWSRYVTNDVRNGG